MEPTPESALRLIHDFPVGIAIVDESGRFRWVNRAYCEILSYTEGQLLSLTWQELTDDRFIAEDQRLANLVKDGTEKSYTIVKAYKKNGSRPEKARLCYGTLTVHREPVAGKFAHFWALFVPHDTQEMSRWRWNWREIGEFMQANYRWILAFLAICAALISGNFDAVSRTMRELGITHTQKQGESSDGSSAQLPSP